MSKLCFGFILAKNASPLVAIVDHEEASREATESLLRSAGNAAESFESTEVFLRSPCRQRAGCLILDVRLPMNGLELQRQIARSGSPIPTVLMTAHEDRSGQMQAQAMPAGALAFLSKPFGEDEMFAAVEMAFGNRGAAMTTALHADGRRRSRP